MATSSFMKDSRFNAANVSSTTLNFNEVMSGLTQVADIYKNYTNYEIDALNYKNKASEVEVNRAITELDSLERQNEYTREALRTQSAQNALYGAVGVDPNFGSAAALRQEVDYVAKKNIDRIKSRAKLSMPTFTEQKPSKAGVFRWQP